MLNFVHVSSPTDLKGGGRWPVYHKGEETHQNKVLCPLHWPTVILATHTESSRGVPCSGNSIPCGQNRTNQEFCVPVFISYRKNCIFVGLFCPPSVDLKRAKQKVLGKNKTNPVPVRRGSYISWSLENREFVPVLFLLPCTSTLCRVQFFPTI